MSADGQNTCKIRSGGGGLQKKSTSLYSYCIIIIHFWYNHVGKNAVFRQKRGSVQEQFAEVVRLGRGSA